MSIKIFKSAFYAILGHIKKAAPRVLRGGIYYRTNSNNDLPYIFFCLSLG